MRKITALIFLLLFFFSVKTTFAKDKNFDISSSSTFKVLENGTTQVNQIIQIKNTTDIYYAPSYAVTLGIKNISQVKVYDKDSQIPFEIKHQADSTEIVMQFKKRIAGFGKLNEFTFYYETNELAKKIGNLWEISIPGLSNPDDFASYTILLQTPARFGGASIIKPPRIASANQSNFTFSKEDIGNSGINIIFGNSQIYKFDLTYHLQNANIFPIKTEIALPPPTSYQNVLLNSITPEPTNVYQDADGNYLAVFTLSPQKKLDVQAKGYIEMLGAPKNDEITIDSNLYTKSLVYWDTNAALVDATKAIKTPRDVYDFVVSKLTYNYNKVANSNTRLGAKGVFASPTNAVCLEFTDLFIAVARSAKIPARAVEGYAYTQDAKLKPLSLIKDILHAWPEYYDSEKHAWIMVDPTWGNTTKGIDYFTNLDFEHIAFVIKGKDSTYPIPAGGYKDENDSKDVSITFATQEEFVAKEGFEVSSSFKDAYISGVAVGGIVTVKNTGNIPLYNKTLIVKSSIDNKEKSFVVDDIPPFGTKSYEVNFDKTPFLTNKSFTIRMQFDTFSKTKTIRVSVFPENVVWYIGGGILVATTLVFIIAFKAWRISVSRSKQEDTVRGESKGS